MYKAIIAIAMWVLFIKGVIAAIVGCVMTGIAILSGDTPAMVYPAISSVGIAALILACVTIKLRKAAD